MPGPPLTVAGLVQRKSTLLVEYKQLKKANAFVDRRFGGAQLMSPGTLADCDLAHAFGAPLPCSPRCRAEVSLTTR